MTQPLERREFFRVHDKVLLDYIPVSAATVEKGIIPPAFAATSGYAMMRELAAIDQENNRLLHSISLANRELELYLRGVNRKIDLIASMLARDEDADNPQHPVRVTLSEAGLSFTATKSASVDSHLTLQLTLLPNHISLVLFARIISCDKNDNNDSFSIGCQFINTGAGDQQLLAKHIMQVQLKQKRQQQEDNPS